MRLWCGRNPNRQITMECFSPSYCPTLLLVLLSDRPRAAENRRAHNGRGDFRLLLPFGWLYTHDEQIPRYKISTPLSA